MAAAASLVGQACRDAVSLDESLNVTDARASGRSLTCVTAPWLLMAQRSTA